MATEIERKFLFDPAKVPAMHAPYVIKQGYIPTEGTTVRIRLKDDRAYLTIKGRARRLTRSEFEYEIPREDALGMLEELCMRPLIEKKRYEVTYEGHVWELDVFEGENEGLFLAEVELQSEDEAVRIPPWVIEEVTHDKRYGNASLAKLPFKAFDKD
jgi:adenylate cyclase